MGITDQGIKRLLKVFLLTIIALICTFLLLGIVFADEVNVGYVSDYTDITLTDGVSGWDLPRETINSNQIDVKRIVIYMEHSTDNDTEYILELSTPNAKLTNINQFVIVGYNRPNQITCSMIQFDNSNTSYPKIHFKCPLTSEYITIQMWNSSGATILTNYDFRWNYTYLRYLTGTNDDNTQDIIDNQNQNTQDIIDNQNQNTQDIIDAQKVCKIFDNDSIYVDKKRLNASGELINDTPFGTSNFISISSDDELYVASLTTSYNSTTRICFYDDSKTLTSCYTMNNLSENQLLTIPSNSDYFRFSIYKEQNKPRFKLCKNGNQSVSDSIDDLNDSINDDSIDTSEATDFFSNFDTDTFGLTSIVTAPLTLIQSLTSSTCSDLELPLPYLNNKKITLPCMTAIYQQHFGGFLTLYQTITYGIVAYWVIVRIFNQVKDFKNPEHDEIEVMDL